MLNVPFFIAAFTSVFWMFYSVKQFHISIFANSTPEQIYQAVFILMFPIAIIWGIVALIKNSATEREFFRYIYLLADQIKKNTENATKLEQTILSSVQTIKNGVTLQEFNALVADTNEILSDIIKRSNSVSSAQLEHLWTRTSGGERWLMSKTFIEINNYQAGFTDHLEKKAIKDTLLKGSILEFIARYKMLHSLLESQDTKKIFYNMIEYGVLGKVYDTLVPIAVRLNNQQKQPSPEAFADQKATLEHENKSNPTTFTLAEEPLVFPSFLSQTEDETIQSPQPTHEEPNNIDVGLRAIREEILTPDTKDAKPQAPIISRFSQTETALRNIHIVDSNEKSTQDIPSRKAPIISLDELEKEINASPENNYDEYSYPFGAWLNEKNKK